MCSLELGCVISDERESILFKKDEIGNQFCFRISVQILPCSEI